MNLTVNGTSCPCADDHTITDVLRERKVDTRFVAVALNGEFIPRGNYATQRLADGDELEILTPLQGG